MRVISRTPDLRQALGFGDDGFEAAGAELAAQLGNDAEGAGMIAALGNLDVRHVARRGENARRGVVVKIVGQIADGAVHDSRAQDSREKRPWAARASPSGREGRTTNGELLGAVTARRQAGCGENLLQLAGAHDGVDFGNVFADLVAEAFDEASGDDEFFCLAAGLVRGHLEDGVDRLLLRAFDERAGIDDDDVGVFGAAGEFGAGAGQQAHHDFAVDEVFGAAQADEAHLLRRGDSGGLRVLRQISLS